MLKASIPMFTCFLVTLLMPMRTLSNPYGYYDRYSRPRRDPASWDNGFGGLVQQNAPLPVVPNSMGNAPSYGGHMAGQGTGMGGSYMPADQHESKNYGVNQYGQGSLDSVGSPLLSRHNTVSQLSSRGSMLHSADPSSYQQQYPSQLDLPSGGHVDPQAPAECSNVACQTLVNCINVANNDSKCCPKCVEYGCMCEGYQVYDCEQNGFSNRMVPEGRSYAVAGGSTVCSCPPGGGSITCSFHDPASSRCPELQLNCIRTFERDLDGCEECAAVGCIGDRGEKVDAGESVDKPPCYICYCPLEGGKLICGVDQSCKTKQSSQDSLAMESSIREINPMGLGNKALDSTGYGGYNGYGGYADYGSQYGQDPSLGTGSAKLGGNSAIIPPIMPMGDNGGAKTAKETSGASKDIGAGLGYLGYQREYGQYGGYGQGAQGYGGNYLGFGGTGGSYGSNPYDANYGQGTGYIHPGTGAAGTSSEDKTDKTGAGGVGGETETESNADGQSGGLGTGTAYQQGSNFPYFPQGQIGSQGDYVSLGQQQYASSQMGGYPYGSSTGEIAGGNSLTSVLDPANKDVPAGDPESTDKKTAEGSEFQNSYLQNGAQNLGYPYPGYGGGGFYPQQPYNPYSNYGQFPSQTGTSKFAGYGNGAAGQYGMQSAGNGLLGGASDSGTSDVGDGTKDSLVAGQSHDENQQNIAFQSKYPYYQYEHSQYPGYQGQYNPNQAASQNEAVDPPLVKPSSPRSYEPVQSPIGQSDKTALNPSGQQNSGGRKIRHNLRVVNKDLLSLEKVKPTTTTTTTTSKTTARRLKSPKSRKNNRVANSKEQVSYENVLSRCCYNGRQWALDHETCTKITVAVGTYSQICAVAQEKCCLEAKEQQYCQGGIDTARSMAACDVPANLGGTCGGNEFKTCCDCCAMGLKALGLGLNCDVKIFGEPCNRAYLDCCQREKMGSILPALPEAAPTVKSQETQEPVGPRCATDSECRQVCKDSEAGMACSCRKGYRLHSNKKDCVDLNECVLNTHTCTEHQFCLNRQGSFICQRRISCGTGYELTERNTCEDIDECGLEIHDCFGNMDCENIRGSFRCIPKLCDEGFFTDATGRCIDLDECRAGEYTCPKGATCVNTDGSYECQCPTGMEPDADNVACEDVDECENGQANCAEGATCLNTLGSFVCRDPPKLRCNPGYEPNSDVSACIDIDECTEGTHTCKAGSTCINQEGGFRCQDPLVCPKGLEPDENQRVCLDINECEDPSLHRCNSGGRCLNLQKTFKCVCNSGYVNAMAEDGVPTCVDVDECATSIGKRCQYMCRNTPGSYECYCPNGYKLANFGSTCEDIDECSQKQSPCGEDQTCFNTHGSFRCVSLACPDGYTGISNTRCQRRSCRGKPRTCLKQPKQISFHNISLANATVVDKPLFRMSLARSHSTDRYHFEISEGNESGDFKIKSSTRIKRPTGVVYTARELVGPKDYVIDLSLKLYRQRRWSTFVSRLYIFVSEHDL